MDNTYPLTPGVNQYILNYLVKKIKRYLGLPLSD